MEERNSEFSWYAHIVRGALQPVLVSWVLVVLFSLFFYAITASAPMLANVTYADATRATTCLWLTTFGGQCKVAGAGSAGYVQLMPLGLTVLICYALYSIMRRRKVDTWAGVATAGLTQAVVVAAIGLAFRPAGSWWIAILGAAALGAVTALWAAREELLVDQSWWRMLEPLFPRTARLGWLLAGYAALAFLFGVLVGIRTIVSLHSSYLAGFWGGLGLALVQLLYLPVVLVWVLAWLLGAGFSIGAGSYFSIFGTALQPIPAIPVFGALHQTSVWAALVLIPVVAGIAILAVREQRLSKNVAEQLLLRRVAAQSALSVLMVAAVLAVLGWITRGSLGPGRLAVMGARADLLMLAVILVVGVPYVAASVIGYRYYLKHPVKPTNETDSDTAAGLETDTACATETHISSTTQDAAGSQNEIVCAAEAGEEDNNLADSRSDEDEEMKDADSI